MIQPIFHALLAVVLLAWNRLVPSLRDTRGWTRAWRRGGVLLALLVLLLGIGVERRLAFLPRRMGDLDVFLRTAWAVRAGQDIYQVVDANGWHYHYPPLFAILMTPLADAPPGADRTGMLPYPVSVAAWFTISIFCLVLAVLVLGRALLPTPPDSGQQRMVNRRRALLCVLAVIACFPPIGLTLFVGQVNLLLLLLICGLAAAVLRGRRGEAGLWLAGAICLKLIPAFLLIYPVWRRDRRCLLGCGLGLVVGLGVVPAEVFGPARAWSYAREWTNVLILPGVGLGNDRSRADELIDVTATDSQSLLTIGHNLLHPDPATRPTRASAAVRGTTLLLGGLLTLLTLVAAGRRARSGPEEVLVLGALVLVMLFVSPVCHRHYFCLAVPVVMGLVVASRTWQEEGRLDRTLSWLFAVNVIANALPLINGLEMLRDMGLPLAAALLLWVWSVHILWRTGTRAQAATRSPFHVLPLGWRGGRAPASG
jgi:hypothetical protein